MTSDTLFMWIVRIDAVIWLVWLALWVPFSKRVIVAWLTWNKLRKEEPYRNDPHFRQWLWRETLDYANHGPRTTR